MAQLKSLAFAPGTMREYETIYILKPDTIGDKVADVNDRVKGIIEDGGGKVIKVDNWGKRRLAYEIKKELKGVYLYWQYLGSPEIVTEFERNLRMLDPVMRYMTVRLDENVDPEARPTEVDDDTYERAATTAALEEEVEAAEGEAAEAGAEGETAEGAAAEASAEGETAEASAEGDAPAESTEEKSDDTADAASDEEK